MFFGMYVHVCMCAHNYTCISIHCTGICMAY